METKPRPNTVNVSIEADGDSSGIPLNLNESYGTMSAVKPNNTCSNKSDESMKNDNAYVTVMADISATKVEEGDSSRDLPLKSNASYGIVTGTSEDDGKTPFAKSGDGSMKLADDTYATVMAETFMKVEEGDSSRDLPLKPNASYGIVTGTNEVDGKTISAKSGDGSMKLDNNTYATVMADTSTKVDEDDGSGDLALKFNASYGIVTGTDRKITIASRGGDGSTILDDDTNTNVMADAVHEGDSSGDMPLKLNASYGIVTGTNEVDGKPTPAKSGDRSTILDGDTYATVMANSSIKVEEGNSNRDLPVKLNESYGIVTGTNSVDDSFHSAAAPVETSFPDTLDDDYI